VWAQIIADICGIEIHAIHFPELTAYGAALFAAEAAGITFETRLSDLITTKRFKPAKNDAYQQWYRDIQKDSIE
jgi:sugar (pentulose or hexulose) kinase